MSVVSFSAFLVRLLLWSVGLPSFSPQYIQELRVEAPLLVLQLSPGAGSQRMVGYPVSAGQDTLPEGSAIQLQSPSLSLWMGQVICHYGRSLTSLMVY